jgi:hypothetical protein
MDAMESPHRGEAPRARAGSLIVRSIGDETVVYDRTTHQAHCLNDVARFVLDRCDGQTPPREIARALRDRRAGVGTAEATRVGEAALVQLDQADLIEGRPATDSRGAGRARSRRATIRALGAASLAPLVLSLTTPTPAEAQTCRDRPCTTSRLCCPEAPCCRSQGPGNPPTCRPGSPSNPNCLP